MGKNKCPKCTISKRIVAKKCPQSTNLTVPHSHTGAIIFPPKVPIPGTLLCYTTSITHRVSPTIYIKNNKQTKIPVRLGRSSEMESILLFILKASSIAFPIRCSTWCSKVPDGQHACVVFNTTISLRVASSLLSNLYSFLLFRSRPALLSHLYPLA